MSDDAPRFRSRVLSAIGEIGGFFALILTIFSVIAASVRLCNNYCGDGSSSYSEDSVRTVSSFDSKTSTAYFHSSSSFNDSEALHKSGYRKRKDEKN